MQIMRQISFTFFVYILMLIVACAPLNNQQHTHNEIISQLELYKKYVNNSAVVILQKDHVDLDVIENTILELHESGMAYNYTIQRSWLKENLNTNDSHSYTLLQNWSEVEIFKLENEIALLQVWKKIESEDKNAHIQLLDEAIEAIKKTRESEIGQLLVDDISEIEKLLHRKKLLQDSDSQSIILFDNSIEFAQEQIMMIKSNPLVLLEK